VHNQPKPEAGWRSAVLAGLLVLTAAVGGGAQQVGDGPVPETFTATTANMEPEGTDLRLNVLRWSDDAEREAVLDVLTSTDSETADDGELDALVELPTLGYVWPDGSALGYSIKYARRDTDAGGGERLTFVTGRRLGIFGRDPWTPDGTPDTALRPFTVIELRLDGNGDGAGTMSPAADVAFDETNQTVALTNYDAAPTLLAAAKRQPAPYWAR
jgi:hypothetical protein